jgi:hypothetical protein
MKSITLIHTYNVLYLSQEDRCNKLKTSYLKCLENKEAPSECKKILIDLLLCVEMSNNPPTIIK